MSMFAKRHYEAVARVCAEARAEDYRDLATAHAAIKDVEDRLVKLFCEDNNKFDPMKFTHRIGELTSIMVAS